MVELSCMLAPHPCAPVAPTQLLAAADSTNRVVTARSATPATATDFTARFPTRRSFLIFASHPRCGIVPVEGICVKEGSGGHAMPSVISPPRTHLNQDCLPALTGSPEGRTGPRPDVEALAAKDVVPA